MAEVTHRFLEMYEGALFLEATFDDVTLDLVQVRVVNNLERDALVRISRVNGSVWKTVTLLPGEQIFTPAGNVRRLDHIPSFGVTA